MASLATQVNRDYRRKRILEKDLAAHVEKLWGETARRYARGLVGNGRIIDLDAEFGDRLQEILSGHYDATGEVFKGRLGARLAVEVAPSADELERIDDALSWAFRERAAAQAELINATTVRQMEDALIAARAETQRLVGEGVARGVRDEATEAGHTLSRRLQARTSGISSLETQAPAEIAKLTEAEVLCGHTPTAAGGSYVELEVIKTWWSKGDDLVRPDHLAADQQEQQLSQPFKIGPDLLMAPGDQSLGAPLEQAIKCRCSSVIDENAVAEVRTARGLGGES